jgi:hypothetical protein
MFETTDDESRQFWAEREKQKGGKISFFTFATFLGRSGDKHRNLGGLLYLINNTLTFEDFEKENWLLKILNRKRDYEKTEFEIKKDDIVETKLVSKNTALNCISGFIDDVDTKTLSGIGSLFLQKVFQIRIKRGYSLFFEIMRAKEFLAATAK